MESSKAANGTSSRAQPISTMNGPSISHRRLEDYPCWATSKGTTSFESSELFDGRLHLWERIPKADSSSDNSSLLSCSDKGSCSTKSTRDSTSTDDIDYLFGEERHDWNSPLRGSEDSDNSSSSFSFTRSSPLAVSDRYVSGSHEMSGYPTHKADLTIKVDGGWTKI